jgi:hypothetical protein
LEFTKRHGGHREEKQKLQGVKEKKREANGSYIQIQNVNDLDYDDLLV